MQPQLCRHPTICHFFSMYNQDERKKLFQLRRRPMSACKMILLVGFPIAILPCHSHLWCCYSLSPFWDSRLVYITTHMHVIKNLSLIFSFHLSFGSDIYTTVYYAVLTQQFIKTSWLIEFQGVSLHSLNSGTAPFGRQLGLLTGCSSNGSGSKRIRPFRK